METRVFTDRRCFDHRVPPGFPERPERLRSLLDGLRESGFAIDHGGEHPRVEELIGRVHEESYVDRFRSAVARGRPIVDGSDNPISAGSFGAAQAAAAVCLRAADWVADHGRRLALAAVRPPGHHAERACAMGFCFFNNIALVAEYLRESPGFERVAIVDFDVHHGNGTQHLFEDRFDVFYVSLHQHPFYPGTGLAGERGRGEGVGATLNIPLAAGSGDARYAEAFREQVLPALRGYHPNVLLISAGLDAWQGDPVGGMRVSAPAFGQWGLWLGELARDLCQGRVVVALEGGYDIPALGELMTRHLRGLAGSRDAAVS